MRTMAGISLFARISLFLLIAFAGLADTAQASPPTSMRRTWFLGEVVAFTTRLLRENRAIEEERLLASMPRISWGQIKAKYRDPDNPKGR